MTTGGQQLTHRGTIRFGAGALCALDAVVGGWALFAPQAFFDHFPGGPFRWISPLGPYSAHLVTDVGGGYLMMAVLLASAAWTAQRRVVQVALVAVIVQAVPHLIWHLMHLHMLDTFNAVGLVIVLVLAVAIPVLLLRLTTKGNA
jgi:hypothetical protein